MKQFAILIFICILTAFSTSKGKEPIEYDEKQELTWQDYKGKPNRSSSFKALTATKISFKASSNGEILSLSIKNSFEPHSSWTKNTESEVLLKHERLHFHISEVYARKLRKEILESQFKSSGQKLITEITKLYEKKMNELTRYQKQYDRETEHSINESKQEEWELTVYMELDLLANYKNSKIEIKLR
jgi:hypothetical protein